jgi:hypothetical protein
MGNIIAPTEEPITITNFIQQYNDISYHADGKVATENVMMAEAENKHCSASYIKRLACVHLSLNPQNNRTSQAVFQIPCKGDMVRNIRYVNPMGVTRVAIIAKNRYNGEICEIEVQEVAQGTNEPERLIAFQNDPFPLCAAKDQDLIISLELDPTGLQNLINNTSYMELEYMMVTSYMRRVLQSHPIALPNNDLVIYGNSIYSTYRDYLDRIGQPKTIDRLTCAMNNLLFEEETVVDESQDQEMEDVSIPVSIPVRDEVDNDQN